MYVPQNTVLSADSYTILNTIRDQIGGMFRASTPLVEDAQSAKAYGQYVTGAGDPRNAFMDALINRIARVMCLVKSYDNHLKKFKKGLLGPGEVVENVWVGLVLPEGYSAHPENPGTVYALNVPDSQISMHPVNSKLIYEITRNDDELEMAITTDLYSFIAKIVDQLYNSAFWDEEILMKYTLCRAILDNWDNVTVAVPALDKTTSNDVLSIMKETSMNLEWMSSEYNPAGVPTHTPIEDQYFFLTNKASAIIDVNSLASAYNLEYRNFIAAREKLKSFNMSTDEQTRLDHIMSETVSAGLVPGYTAFTTGEKEKLGRIVGATIDKDFFFIFDKVFKMATKYNEKYMYTNIFLNIWKVYSYNPFANIVVYAEPNP